MNDTPSPTRSWVLCGILLLATMLNYMDRQALAVTLPTLKANYELGEKRIGLIEGYFGYSFALGSLLFGWIADRTGPRLLYPLVLAGWSLAGIATSFAGQPWVVELLENSGDPPGTGVFRWLFCCRVALGIFEAGHWPCALLTVRAILSAEKRALGNSILQSGASIGAILVPLYMLWTEWLGKSWEFPFWTIGLVGFLWIPAWFAATHGFNLSRVASKESDAQRGTAMDGAPQSSPHATARVIQRLIVLAIMIATLAISWQFLRAWLALYLEDHQGYSKEATRGLLSGYFISTDVGCILSGALVTMLASRGWRVDTARLFGYAIFSLLATCAALAPFAPSGWLMIGMLYIAGAGILGLHPYYYALTQEISDKRMGLLSGLLAAFGWIASSVFQIYVGETIQKTQSYAAGLMIVGLAPICGFIVLALAWPRENPNG